MRPSVRAFFGSYRASRREPGSAAEPQPLRRATHGHQRASRSGQASCTASHMSCAQTPFPPPPRAQEGHAGVVSLLLGAGAHLEDRNHDDMTPLAIAAYYGHAEAPRPATPRPAPRCAAWRRATRPRSALAARQFARTARAPSSHALGPAAVSHYGRARPL
jgi:hypothetical protein